MEKTNKFENKKLLAVLAHPDDETFGMGGTLAYYAYQGAEVSLICVTHGEAGDVDPKYLNGYKDVAELRAAELMCAVNKLGGVNTTILDYRDSGMEGTKDNEHPRALVNAPLEKVASEIATQIRRIRPQVIITHDPIGNYYHPDHIATHKATLLAFDLAGDYSLDLDGLPPFQADKLFYNTMNRSMMRFLIKIMPLLKMDPEKYGRNGDINMKKIVEMEFPVNAMINYKKYEAYRVSASACHASQGGGGREMTFYGRLRKMLASTKDNFMQAYPEPNGKVAKDLFE